MANIIHGNILTVSGYIHALQVINHPNPYEEYVKMTKDPRMSPEVRKRFLAERSVIDGLARNFQIITYDKEFLAQGKKLKLKVHLSEGFLAEYRGDVIYVRFVSDPQSEPALVNDFFVSADTGILVYKDSNVTFIDAGDLTLDTIIPAITMKPGFDEKYTPHSLFRLKTSNFDGYVRKIEYIKRIENYKGPGVRLRSSVETLVLAPGIFIA